MVTMSDFFADGRLLLPPDVKKETKPPNNTTASMIPMTRRLLFALGGAGGLGNILGNYLPDFAGWVARPIWLMPERPSTSNTSMTPWYWL